MSPEYAQNGELTFAGGYGASLLSSQSCCSLNPNVHPTVDIYAFGVLLLEMLTTLRAYAVPVPGTQHQFLDLVSVTREARQYFESHDQDTELFNLFLDSQLSEFGPVFCSSPSFSYVE